MAGTAVSRLQRCQWPFRRRATGSPTAAHPLGLLVGRSKRTCLPSKLFVNLQVTITVLLFAAHMSVTKMCLRMLTCFDVFAEGQEVPVPVGEHPATLLGRDFDDACTNPWDRHWRLVADPSICCNDAGTWTSLQAIALPGLVLFSFGIPLVSIGLMTRLQCKSVAKTKRRVPRRSSFSRKAASRRLSMLLRPQADMSNSALHTGIGAVKYGFLTKGFKYHAYFWECIVMLRKVVVAAIAVFMAPLGVSNQVHAALALLFFFGILQSVIQPYQTRALNLLELSGLVCAFVTLLGGLALGGAANTGPSAAPAIPGPIVTWVLLTLNMGFFLLAVSVAFSQRAASWRSWKVLDFCAGSDDDGEETEAEVPPKPLLKRALTRMRAWVGTRTRLAMLTAGSGEIMRGNEECASTASIRARRIRAPLPLRVAGGQGEDHHGYTPSFGGLQRLKGDTSGGIALAQSPAIALPSTRGAVGGAKARRSADHAAMASQHWDSKPTEVTTSTLHRHRRLERQVTHPGQRVVAFSMDPIESEASVSGISAADVFTGKAVEAVSARFPEAAELLQLQRPRPLGDWLRCLASARLREEIEGGDDAGSTATNGLAIVMLLDCAMRHQGGGQPPAATFLSLGFSAALAEIRGKPWGAAALKGAHELVIQAMRYLDGHERRALHAATGSLPSALIGSQSSEDRGADTCSDAEATTEEATPIADVPDMWALTISGLQAAARSADAATAAVTA